MSDELLRAARSVISASKALYRQGADGTFDYNWVAGYEVDEEAWTELCDALNRAESAARSLPREEPPPDPRFTELRARVKSRYADGLGTFFLEGAQVICDLEMLLTYIDMGEPAGAGLHPEGLEAIDKALRWIEDYTRVHVGAAVRSADANPEYLRGADAAREARSALATIRHLGAAREGRGPAPAPGETPARG